MAVSPLKAVGMVTSRDVLPVGIVGLGAHLPERVVTNDELARVLDTSDEWIRSRTGIVERRIVDPDDATSDLAERAGRAALADAGMDAADLQAIVLATTTSDQPMPPTAPIVAHRLGTTAAALDVNAACTGFVYALRVACGLVATGTSPLLLIGAETLTRLVDPADRSTAVLFGDGAAAVVLAPDGDAGVGPFDLGSDGALADLLWVPGGADRGSPSSLGKVGDGSRYLRMRGREVYRHAVMRMASSAAAVLEQAGMSPGEIDLFVGHQANVRILDAVASRLGIPADRAHITVDRHGNTSAASVPLALEDARRAGRLHTGTRVLLTAFGAGLTWGSCLLTVGDALPTAAAGTATGTSDAGRDGRQP